MGKKIFLLIITTLAVIIAQQFLVAIAMGAVFSILLYPTLIRLQRLHWKSTYSSLFLTLGFTLVVLIPAAVLLLLGVKAGYQQFELYQDNLPSFSGADNIQSWFIHSRLHDWVEKFADYLSIKTESLMGLAADFAKRAGVYLAGFFANILSSLPSLGMSFLILVVSIYFFLSDGQKLLTLLRKNHWVSKVQTEDLFQTTASLCRSVVLASVFSGFLQSIVFTIVCLIAGVDNPTVIGLSVFLCSFIPIIGATPVTLGVAAFQWISIGNGLGVTLLVTAIIVAALDNIVRPMVLKGKAHMHPLIAFISAFGGLHVMGFSGLFLGPIIMGIFVAIFPYLLNE